MAKETPQMLEFIDFLLDTKGSNSYVVGQIHSSYNYSCKDESIIKHYYWFFGILYMLLFVFMIRYIFMLSD